MQGKWFWLTLLPLSHVAITKKCILHEHDSVKYPKDTSPGNGHIVLNGQDWQVWPFNSQFLRINGELIYFTNTFRNVLQFVIFSLTNCIMSHRVFHNSRLIRWIQQDEIYNKVRDLTRDWTRITCLTVSHPNYYTRIISVLVSACNWMLLMPVQFI